MMLVYRQMLERYWDLMSSTSDWSCGCDLTWGKLLKRYEAPKASFFMSWIYVFPCSVYVFLLKVVGCNSSMRREVKIHHVQVVVAPRFWILWLNRCMRSRLGFLPDQFECSSSGELEEIARDCHGRKNSSQKWFLELNFLCAQNEYSSR